MADVKWIKIITDIFDDEKILLIESLPAADSIIVIWFKLLCLAGKQNNSGVFMLNDKIPYTEEMLATIFRREPNTVRLALETFERFGMIERFEGVITIPNWGKHQNLDQLENKKQYMRNYMKEYRSKQKLLADKSNCKTNNKTNVSEADKDKDIDIDIDIDKDNKEKKERKKTGKTGYDEILSSIPDESLKELYLEYIKMRKLIKSPMTDRALTMLINKVNELEPDNIERQKKLLETAIVNNWKSVYPLKDDPEEKPKQQGQQNKNSGNIFLEMLKEE